MDNNKKYDRIVKLRAFDHKQEENSLIYINDKLELTSNDSRFIEGFIEGATKSLKESVVTEYEISVSHENVVKDAMSWLYSKSGGLQIFTELHKRIKLAQAIDIIEIA